MQNDETKGFRYSNGFPIAAHSKRVVRRHCSKTHYLFVFHLPHLLRNCECSNNGHFGYGRYGHCWLDVVGYSQKEVGKMEHEQIMCFGTVTPNNSSAVSCDRETIGVSKSFRFIILHLQKECISLKLMGELTSLNIIHSHSAIAISRNSAVVHFGFSWLWRTSTPPSTWGWYTLFVDAE